MKLVLHEFYSKGLASRAVVNVRSTLPWNCKRKIFMQELLRNFLNCNREFPWKNVVDHANYMKLSVSGNRFSFAAYKRLVELDASDKKPFYRPRE